MLLFAYAKTGETKPEIFVQGHEDESITIYSLTDMGVQSRKSDWSEVDGKQERKEIKFFQTIRTFHSPWKELFSTKLEMMQ